MDREPGTVTSAVRRVGVAGGAVMAVSFGMARYAYGLTLPGVREALVPSDLVLGAIGSSTFAGFLVSLLAAPRLAGWKGPRAPTTVGGVSATVGCALVATASSPVLLALGASIAGSAAGWVWASYSTIAVAVADRVRRPRLLATITAGAAVGLVAVGCLGLLVGSWRWVWAGVAVAAAGATLTNLRFVPRLPPAPRPGRPEGRPWVGTELVRPTLFAVVLFLATTVYFTYATDAAERGGLGDTAGPVVFVLVGASGLVGIAAGWGTGRAGGRAVATAALVLLGAALVLLGLGAGSLSTVLLSAALFGAANTVGSAALPVWTAALAPDRAAEAFTTTLVAGSVSSVLTPTLVGTLLPVVGLRPVLLGAAVLSATTAGLIHLVRRAPGRRVSTGRGTPRRRGRAGASGRSRRGRRSTPG